MPVHLVAAHLVVILAPMVAVAALVYAALPRSRRSMRWPLVAGALLSAALVGWAGDAGGELLDRVKVNGSPGEIAAATAHAKGSDNLSVAVFAVLGLVLLFAWWLLRPGRDRGAASLVAAGLLAIGAVSVLGTTWITLMQAFEAVAENHPSWTG